MTKKLLIHIEKLQISDKFFKLVIIQNFPLNLNKKINYKTLLKINNNINKFETFKSLTKYHLKMHKL